MLQGPCGEAGGAFGDLNAWGPSRLPRTAILRCFERPVVQNLYRGL